VLIDTHAHVHDKAFDADRDAVVERMRAAGIVQAVTVGCDLEDSRRALACAEQFGLYASAGIHPHEAKDAPGDLEAAFAPFLGSERIVAIGETGLDYYYDRSPRDRQRDVLRAHIDLAAAHGKPVIFHHRDAFEDFVTILRERWRPGMRGVVHCFTGDVYQAQTYVSEFGLYLGIGGVLTFKTAQQVRDAVQNAGLDNVVLETDCPYLAPVPHRGSRNEPAYSTETAKALAALLAVDRERVDEVTTRNAQALFSIQL
jgi:TatD DNase family protein